MSLDFDPRREVLTRPAIRQRTIDGLIVAGVPPMALGRPDVLTRGSVIFDQTLFSFSDEVADNYGVVTAVLILVRDATGVPLDVVAWRRDRVASWLGRAWCLGEDCLSVSSFDEAPVPVWRTPLQWLRNSRRGLVILNYEVARWRLADGRSLLAEDFDHGRALRARLRLPEPRIFVPKAERVVA